VSNGNEAVEITGELKFRVIFGRECVMHEKERRIYQRWLKIPGKKRQNEYVMVLEVPPKLEMLELLETQPYFLESQSETTFESGILGEIPHAV